MIKLIIFDLDGTLVDAYIAIYKSFNFTMAKLGYSPKSFRRIKKAVGWGDENLLRPFIMATDLNRALQIYRNHHQKALLTYSRLLPLTRKVLAILKNRGYKLAIASNRPYKFSRILLRGLKINRYFNYILCADQIKHGKPHPEILLKIMKRFKLLPKETLYVGDMTLDIEAGHRAGVVTIAVTGGSSTRQELKQQKPCKIIKDISFLDRVLKIINA